MHDEIRKYEFKNIIFMGSSAFKTMCARLNIDSECSDFKYKEITFKLSQYLEPLQCATLDKDLIEYLDKYLDGLDIADS